MRKNMHILKRLRSSNPYELSIFIIVAIATLLRFILIYFNWPVTNSDEGNMGLLTLHVAYQGDRPAFFYGLPYMGPLEGYVAAPLFHLFGSSLFTLRLGLLLFFVGFLLSMYYLVRLLYSEKFALAMVILLSLGSSDVISRQLKGVGEYPETAMFAALICLLAVWLGFSSPLSDQKPTLLANWKRIIVYGFLGLIVGLALWVDFLIAPFVLTAGLLLCLFCRRELLHWPGLSLLLGIIIGAFPLIYYNLTAPLSQNSWNILLFIHQGGAKDMAAQHLTRVDQLIGTMMIALPLATGANPRCPMEAFPPSGAPTASTLPCVLFQSGWSFGYLILWFIAAFFAVRIVWHYRRSILLGFASDNSLEEHRREALLQCGRLMLLASVAMTLVLYAISPSAAVTPITSFRYLTCMLLAIPALLWPIWQGLNIQKYSLNWRTKGAFLLKAGLPFLVAMTFLSGTVRTFTEIPEAQAAYHSEETLIQDLMKIGATRIYSEYWTCNRLTFHSQEKIICSELDEHLKPSFERYLPYRSIVRAAPHPTYVFPLNSPQAEVLKQHISISDPHYRQYIFEGYVVYRYE